MMQAHTAYQSLAGEQAALDQRNTLILEELPQVYFIAARIHERLPASVQIEDLVSAGVVGLIEACKNFDAARNAQFKTFARFRIRGAILDSLRASDWGSRGMRRKGREIAEAAAQLEGLLGRKAEKEEIAAEMKISLDQLETMITQIDSLLVVGQQTSPSNEWGDVQDLVESAPGHELSPFDLLFKAEQTRHISAAVAALNEREQMVLSLYYKEELTMKEVAQVIGIALSRVSQIHSAAIEKLRVSLAALEKRPVLDTVVADTREQFPALYLAANADCGPRAGDGARVHAR